MKLDLKQNIKHEEKPMFEETMSSTTEEVVDSELENRDNNESEKENDIIFEELNNLNDLEETKEDK